VTAIAKVGIARLERRSQFWVMPPRARAFVVLVDAVYAAAITLGLMTTHINVRDVWTFTILVGCALLSIETSLRLVWRHPQDGTRANDLLAVWTIPVALLLPPLYGALAVVPLLGFSHLRVAKRALVKLLFSIAATGLAGFGAATIRVVLSGHDATLHALVGTPSAALATVACVATRYAINGILVGEVVALTKQGMRLRAHFDAEYWVISAAESCTAVLVAIACAASAYTILLAIPPVLVFQRTLLMSQFREAARTDQKTGLANSSYWREVAERAVARARSGHDQLAILLCDVDHFKEVNDRFGHLTGDETLRAVASALTEGMRPQDFVGRFGGEEFVVLLAGSDLDQARHAAERIREHVAEVSIEAPNRNEWVRVTISIGVAAFRDSGHSINELLDAADSALYAAKAAGRNCVRVAEHTRQQTLDLTPEPARVLDLREQRAPAD